MGRADGNAWALATGAWRASGTDYAVVDAHGRHSCPEGVSFGSGATVGWDPLTALALDSLAAQGRALGVDLTGAGDNWAVIRKARPEKGVKVTMYVARRSGANCRPRRAVLSSTRPTSSLRRGISRSLQRCACRKAFRVAVGWCIQGAGRGLRPAV